MAKHVGMWNALRISALALVSLCAWGLTLRAADPGETLYKSKCAACHGADGKGDTPVGKMYKLRALGSAEVQKQSDDVLTSIISKGKNKMPGYGRALKEDQIGVLVSYVRALAKK
jgi:cytochrome c6